MRRVERIAFLEKGTCLADEYMEVAGREVAKIVHLSLRVSGIENRSPAFAPFVHPTHNPTHPATHLQFNKINDQEDKLSFFEK